MDKIAVVVWNTFHMILKLNHLDVDYFMFCAKFGSVMLLDLLWQYTNIYIAVYGTERFHR